MKLKLSRPVIAIVLAAAVILGSATWLWFSEESPPPTKKITPTEKSYHWYVQFSVKNQKSTAYVEEAGAPLASSGISYFIGGVAVHPLYPGASPLDPAIPFGTTIFLNKPVEVQGQSLQAFKVIDTGDVNFGRFGSSPYWFDIFWGTAGYYNTRQASDYGAKTVDYYWFEPWR